MELPHTGFHLIPNNEVEKLFWGQLYVEKATSYLDYKPGSNTGKILHRLKYNNDPELAEVMGRMVATELQPADFFKGIDLIIPVPLHKRRKRQRGYNQSEHIARGISGIIDLPILSDVVSKVVETKSQTRLSTYERMINVKGVFRVNDPELLSGKHILIVDDVLTTGATITSLGEALSKISGVKLSILTLAVAHP